MKVGDSRDCKARHMGISLCGFKEECWEFTSSGIAWRKKNLVTQALILRLFMETSRISGIIILPPSPVLSSFRDSSLSQLQPILSLELIPALIQRAEDEPGNQPLLCIRVLWQLC